MFKTMKNIVLILILFASFMFPRGAAAQTIILTTDTVQVNCASADTFLVPVRVQNFTNVGSFQFTISWDTTRLDYAYTTPMNPLLLGSGVTVGFDSLSFINQNPARMTVAWTKFNGGSVPDSTIIFSLAFSRIGGPFAPVQLSSIPAAIEFTDPLGNVLNAQAISGGVDPIDDKNPTIVCPANVVETVTLPSAVDSIAPVSVDDNCSIFTVGWTSTGATTFSAPTDPDASGSVFNFGMSTVVYTATDIGGNTATCSFTITLTPAITSDTLTIIAQNASASCGQQVSIDITAFNFDSLGSLQFSFGWDIAVLNYVSVGNFNPALLLSGTNFNVIPAPTGVFSFNWTTNSLTGTTIPQGAVLFTLTYSAVGNSGGSSPLQFVDLPSIREAYTSATAIPEEVPAIWINGSVAIQDLTPPTISCPQNVLVNAPTGSITAMVANLQPLALSDNCSGVIGLSYSRVGATQGMGTGNANGTYNAGGTIVVYTATDAAGNTSTCSFLVVVDAGTPVTIELDTVTTDCQGIGDTISVNMYVSDFTDIIGLQFGINWDETVLQFLSVSNFFPGLVIPASGFNNFANTGSGLLQFAYGDPNGWPVIPDGGIFFTINYVVLDANNSTSIEFVGPFEASNSSLDIIPIDPVSGYFSTTDISAPVITCPADTVVTALPGNCTAIVALPFAQANDACTGIQSIFRDPVSNIFSEGNAVVTFTATDNAGNSATCAVTVTVNVNSGPQIINCPGNITVDAPGAACQTSVFWVPPTGIEACTQNPLTPIPSQDTGSSFIVGATTVTYQVTDGLGNTATCSFSVLVRDTVAPTITCPADITVYTCCVSGVFQAPQGADNCDQNLDVFGDYTPDSIFCNGTTMVHYTASDDFGNSAMCSFSVTVLDTLAPDISGCPADIMVSTDVDTCGAFVFWDEPTASDSCTTGILLLDATYTPGEFFDIGSTLVEYTVSDNEGNVSACSFTVTVTEDLPPVIVNCPANIIIELPNTDCEVMVPWMGPQASDNCGLDSFTVNIPPNSVFLAGQDTVVYTATDLAGNVTVCSFIVYVNDNVPPVLSGCPPDVITVNSGPCGVIPPWTFPTATDNCSNPVITSPFTPDSSFTVGIHTFLILATDNSGNQDTCTVIIDVNGVSPSFNPFPGDISMPGCAEAITWDSVIAIGICQLDSVTSNYNSGDQFPVGTTLVIYMAWENGIQVVVDSFKISIVETVPPQITCPTEPITVNTAGAIISDADQFLVMTDTVAGCMGVELIFDLPLAIDNCSGVGVDQTDGLLSGMVFQVGSDTLVFQATDAAGNQASCSVTVVVLPISGLRPVADPNPACNNLTTTITVQDYPGAVYTWTGPNLQNPGNGPVIMIVSSVQNSGVYYVTANINGCLTPLDSVTLYQGVSTNATDDVLYQIDPTMTDTFSSVLLNDIFSPGVGYHVEFISPPAGLTMLPDGSFIYTAGPDAGVVSFFYQLCAEAACPAADTCDMATVTITVRNVDCSFIPNVITPNGDGLNDYLNIPCIDSGILFLDNSLVVYNQWGDKVYEASPYSNAPDKAWRGTLLGESGKDLPDGTYFYIFKPGPNEAPIKGFVEIFR